MLALKEIQSGRPSSRTPHKPFLREWRERACSLAAKLPEQAIFKAVFPKEETAMHQVKHQSDRRQPALSEDACEVAHFARIFHLTMPEARMLIREYGSNLARLKRAARTLAADAVRRRGARSTTQPCLADGEAGIIANSEM